MNNCFKSALYFRKENKQIPDFHVVFAHGGLANFVRHNLQKSDRVFLRGHLAGNALTDADGKRSHSGHIIAEKIDKIKRRDISEKTQSSVAQE